jgi:hypothetical protein
LGADPAQAAARYAAVNLRCAMCNRALRAAESNGYGIGFANRHPNRSRDPIQDGDPPVTAKYPSSCVVA